VVSISELPIFTTDLIDSAHRLLCALLHPQPTTVTIVLAMERCSSFNDYPSAQLCLHDTRYLAALRSVTGEGMAVDIHQEKSSIFDLISTDQLEFVVIHLQSSMTKGKGALPIRHRLCTHSTTLQQLTATVSWAHFDWLHCTLDPDDAHLTIDPTINLIPSSHAYHPDRNAKFLPHHSNEALSQRVRVDDRCSSSVDCRQYKEEQ